MTPTVFWSALFCFICNLSLGFCDNETSCVVCDFVARQAELCYRAIARARYYKAVRPRDFNNVTSIRIAFGSVADVPSYMTLHEGYVDVRMLLHMSWTDDAHFAWDPFAETMLFRVSQQDVWHPDVMLLDALPGHYAADIYVSVTCIRLVLWDSLITARVPCTMDMTDFPYDVHDCTLRFASLSYTDDDILYDRYFARRIYGMATPGWELVHAEIRKERLCNRTSLTLLSRLRRSGGSYRYTVTLPAIAMTVTTLIVPWMPTMSSRRLTLGSANLLALMLMLVHLTSFFKASLGVPRVVIHLSVAMVINVAILVTSILAPSITVTSVSWTEPPRVLLQFLRNPIVAKVACLNSTAPKHSSSDELIGQEEDEDTDHESSTTSYFIKSSERHLLLQALDRILFVVFFIVLTAMSIWSF